MRDLTGRRIAVFIGRGFEESELTGPARALRDAGAEVVLIGPDAASVRDGVRGEKGGEPTIVVRADATIDQVQPEGFDGLVIPGGRMPDRLRTDDRFLEFIRRFDALSRPIAAICHGPQMLISAGVLRNRTLTCYRSVRDDVINAGARYVDEPVIIDGHLISARHPGDLPAFNEAIIEAVAQRQPVAGS